MSKDLMSQLVPGGSAAVREGSEKRSREGLHNAVERRLRPQTIAVMLLMHERPEAWRYGYELSQHIEDTSPATVYGILGRLSEDGYVEDQYVPPKEPGSRPHRAYRFTPAGLRYAKAVKETDSAARRMADVLIKATPKTPQRSGGAPTLTPTTSTGL